MKSAGKIAMIGAISFLLQEVFLCSAQTFHTAENYIIKLRNEHQLILKEFLFFSGEVVHSRNIDEAIAMQAHLIASVGNTLHRVSELSCYMEDCSMRDSLVSYLSFVYRVLKEDRFQKLNFYNLNHMSYNEVDSIISANGATDREMHQKAKNLEVTQLVFAKRFNVALSPERDPLSGKIEVVNSLNDYYNYLFLIFFKSYKLEYQLLEEIDSMDFKAAENTRMKLIESAIEGLSNLGTIGPFKNDSTLILVCRNILTFYLAEAHFQVPVITDYFKKRELFETRYEDYQLKSESFLNDPGLDEYNCEAEILNNTHEEVLLLQQELSKQRSSLIFKWNLVSADFMKKHITGINQ
ncbi:MAG: hypothetical protein JXB00_20975 [Bacteroidales bacterium]|nr:hypothetical protein [Bacteroidales bacterium]